MSTTEASPTNSASTQSNEEIIGRADVNDLEAILAVANTDVDEVIHDGAGQRRRHLHVGLREGRPPGARQALREGQDVEWNGETDLPWDTEVDQEAVVIANAEAMHGGAMIDVDVTGTPFEKWGDEEWLELRRRVPELDALASSCTASRVR